MDNTYNIKPIINASRCTDPTRKYKVCMKRDPNLFPVLGCKTRMNNFNQALMIEVKAQDLDDVINLSYIPHD